MAPGSPRIAVIVLNWNHRDDVLACIASLAAATDAHDRLGLVVVDNASTDGSAEAVRQQLARMADNGWPHVELVENGANLGFSGGNNAGYRRVPPEYGIIHLSNDDAAFMPGALDVIARTFDDPKVGVVGARVVRYDAPAELAHGAGYLRPLLCGTRSVDAREPVDCDFVTGCALAVRRDALRDLGGELLDPAFFAYWEDTDLCARVRARGWRVVYQPAAVVRHRVGASLGPRGASAARVYLETHGKARYARKHLAPLALTLFTGLYALRFPAFALKQLGQPATLPAMLRAYARGVLDGLAGRSGRLDRVPPGPTAHP